MPESTPVPFPDPASRPGPTGHRARALARGGERSDLPFPYLAAPFALQAAARPTPCPPPAPDLGEPSACLFAYGLTLPSASGSPTVAQDAAEAVLDVHGVEEDLFDPAVTLVRELAIHACRFTGAGEMVHLMFRRAAHVLQVVVHDTHAPHFHPLLADQCVERRRVSLSAAREVTEKHRGEWGFAAAQPPAQGVCTWATLRHDHAPSSPPDNRPRGSAT